MLLFSLCECLRPAEPTKPPTPSQLDPCQAHAARQRRRGLDEARVFELAESIDHIGLLHPIAVTSELAFIAGRAWFIQAVTALDIARLR